MAARDNQNRDVHGLALCVDELRENFTANVDSLRAQQEAYRDSLPKDPLTACKAVNSAIGGAEDHDSDMSRVEAVLIVLRELLTDKEVDGYPALGSALVLMADDGIDAIPKVQAATKTAADSVRNELAAQRGAVQ